MTQQLLPDAVTVSSRVRLARNYEDFPFDLTDKAQQAEACVARTANALAVSPCGESFRLTRLDSLEEDVRPALAEERLISQDLLRNAAVAAVFLSRDDSVSLMVNEDDHLRLQATRPGLHLEDAADAVFALEDALSRQVRFAFDSQLGYLTSCPTNTGTGMRASLLLHLPMLTQAKQMGSVGQIAAKVGLTVRGVYGEGSEALGQLYKLSNQVTLGRTEQEIIATVTAVGRQLSEMEAGLRQRTLQDERTTIEDQVYRGWALLRSARLMGLDEFFALWSSVRLGSALGLLPAELSMLDRLLPQVQPHHLKMTDPNVPEDAARAARVRQVLGDAAQDGLFRL